uniref:Helitron_like_N domain-containing protein n=1 Tax=Rhabditophanes sp. KR3021 TaxID=114890 RepID=A0AC35U0Z5_9BILA
MDAATKEIDQIMPNIIFLQKVANDQAQIINHKYGNIYNIYYQRDDLKGFFTAITVSKKHQLLERTIESFKTTSDAIRAKQIVLINVDNTKFALINSTLEGGVNTFRERELQLKECVELINHYQGRSYHVIFGGSLNIRNDEADEIEDSTTFENMKHMQLKGSM